MLTTSLQRKRKRLLAKIHMTPECVNLKKMDAWGDFVYVRYGVESCKTLSIAELEKIADELIKGVVPKEYKPDIKGRILVREESNKAKISAKQLYYMKELWKEKSKNKDESSLLNFTAKVIKKQYLYLELIKSYEATKIIAVLEKKL